MEKMISPLRNERLKKKEQLENTVEMKIAAIQELRDFVKTQATMPPAEFEKALNGKIDRIYDSFGPNFDRRFREYSDLRKQQQAAFFESFELDDVDEFSSDEELIGAEMEYDSEELKEKEAKIAELHRQAEELEEKINKLENDDVKFASRIKNFAETIVQKRWQAYRLEKMAADEPDEFWKRISLQTRVNFSDADIDECQLRFPGHSVGIIIPAETFVQTLGKGFDGIHYRGTVINMIKLRKNMESTIDHEENHNLAESFDGAIEYAKAFIKKIQNHIQRINRFNQLQAPQIVIDEHASMMNESIQSYINQNFSELVADFGKPPKDNVSAYLTYFTDSFDQADKFINSVENKKIKTSLLEGLKGLENKFIRHLESLSRIYFAAEHGGELDKAQAAILLYGPQGLPKVERYIQQQLGTAEYDLMDYFRKGFTRGNYFTGTKVRAEDKFLGMIMGKSSLAPSSRILDRFSVLQRISLLDAPVLKEINSRLDSLSPDQRRALMANVHSIFDGDAALINLLSNGMPSISAIQDVSVFQEIQSLLNQMFEKMDLPGLKDQAETELSAIYLGLQYNRCIETDNFKPLEQIWEQWKGDKAAIEESLLSRVRNGDVNEDYQRMYEKEYSDETIRQTNFWKLIQSLGFEEKALKAQQEKIAEEE